MIRISRAYCKHIDIINDRLNRIKRVCERILKFTQRINAYCDHSGNALVLWNRWIDIRRRTIHFATNCTIYKLILVKYQQNGILTKRIHKILQIARNKVTISKKPQGRIELPTFRLLSECSTDWAIEAPICSLTIARYTNCTPIHTKRKTIKEWSSNIRSTASALFVECFAHRTC